MLNPPSLYRQSRFWLIAIHLLLFSLWVIAFYPDIVRFYLGATNPEALTALGIRDVELRKSQALLALNLVSFPVFLLIMFWMVSQFILPIKQPSERIKVFKRLLRYLLRRHGPAVFIQEGQIQGEVSELRSLLPGVAFVDLSSALVLETQPFAPVAPAGVSAWERRRRLRSRRLTHHVATPAGPRLIRAEGPGVVFTEAGERIRGVVSLRRQVSIQSNIQSITRDGFEVSTTIITIFTLGEHPDVLPVGYLGERAEDLRVLKFDEATHVLVDARDELDEEDKKEIHRQFQWSVRTQEYYGETSSKPPSLVLSAPYIFDGERVFKAIYGEAHDPQANETVPWLSLPGQVAVEIFHNLISQYHYADLYQPKDEKRFPFNEVFRPEFSRRVRNQGVLSYQLVVCNDGQPLQIGKQYAPSDLTRLPPSPLTNAKVLRDRGIKVISATLAELRPVNPAVRQQLLDYWRAQWQRERDIQLASYDYQELRVRAASRMQVQSSIVKSLTEILQDHSISREMAALRLLQAIESYAREPLTEKMVPLETMSTLRYLVQRVSEGSKLPGSEWQRGSP